MCAQLRGQLFELLLELLIDNLRMCVRVCVCAQLCGQLFELLLELLIDNLRMCVCVCVHVCVCVIVEDQAHITHTRTNLGVDGGVVDHGVVEDETHVTHAHTHIHTLALAWTWLVEGL